MAGLRNAILTVEQLGARGLSEEIEVRTFLPLLSYPTPYTGQPLQSSYAAEETCLEQAVVNGPPSAAGRPINR